MFLKRHFSKTEVFGEVVDALNVQFLSNTRIYLVNKQIPGIALIENYEVWINGFFARRSALLCGTM